LASPKSVVPGYFVVMPTPLPWDSIYCAKPRPPPTASIAIIGAQIPTVK
jgi:hypothetical protein